MSVARKIAEIEAISAADEKNNLQAEIKALQEQITTITINAVKNDSAEELDGQLTHLKELIAAKNEELIKLTESSNLTTEMINEKISRLEELDASIKALEGRILSDEKRVEEIKGLLTILNADLDDLTNLKASVLRVEEGSGTVWEITPGDDKKRLIELIHELVDAYGSAYPVLRKELLKVEWSTVWLPQLQQLCVRENLDRSGIYKITLKTNDRIVYIGQAQSIKDR
jgi:chromosome segregation ATPase